MRIILLFSFLMTARFCAAQNGYPTGAMLPGISDTKILNYSDSTLSLSGLKNTITIVDFFGTWCAPCLKALPMLDSWQTSFKNELRILLVSTEPESKLRKFIHEHRPFNLPVLVDENGEYSRVFQPGSYPYTVVLDKNLKVMSVTNTADLTEDLLRKFIATNESTIKIIANKSTGIVNKSSGVNTTSFKPSNNELVKLSQDFIYAAKTGDDAADYIQLLKDLPFAELTTNLKTDDEKKAFWINLYNAYTNASLHANPDQYKKRKVFFKKKNIVVAGKKFSLDDIEHGILRKSKIKWSLGYFNKLFPGKTEKQLRVQQLDYRIHFALNCGAKSCPPIAFYNPENLDAQLELSTNAYLAGEVEFDPRTNVLQLPVLISWFRRDFGGKQKVIALLKQKGLLQADVHPKIKFKHYDWSLYLNNFKQ